MKKILPAFAILIITLSLVAPAFTARAQGVDAWEDAQTTPGFTGDLTESADLVQWVGNWTGRNIGYVVTHGRYTCVTPECSYAVDVYIEINIHVAISDIPGGGPYTLVVDGGGTNKVTVDCSSTSECGAHAFFVYPAEDNETNPPWAGYFAVTYTLSGQVDATTSWDIDTKMTRSADQINTSDCDETYQVVDPITPATVIPVTSETGATSTLVAGNTYRITVNGWWDDGETHIRRDTAIKQGEDDWMNTDELITAETVLCKQMNVTDASQVQFVFTAVDADFSIRVNDTVGDFADNTTAMISGQPISYQIELVREVQPFGCETQFMTGSLLKTFSVAASNSNGGTVIPTQLGLAPGQWLTVMVSGTWQNNGSGAERSDIAMRSFTYDTWTELSGSPFTNCVDEETNKYYIQLIDSDVSYLSFRANDTDGTWASNTGTLTVSLYATTYDPLPAACEEQYLIGQLVNTGNIAATSSAGLAIMAGKNDPPWPAGGESLTRYLMVETFGNPFSDGTEYSGSPNLNDEGIWYFPTNMPSATCVVKTDQVGHYRIYFEFSIGKDYGIRVHDNDGNYANNSGTMGWNVYHATYYDPDLTDCADYYNHEPDPLITYTLNGASESGSILPALTSDAVYAVVTSNGPWTDDGVSTYDVAMTAGSTYSLLQDFPGALCSSVDGNYVTMYFKATEGRDYRLRVGDADDDFTNNGGTITATVYAADSDADPWSSCSENYTMEIVPLTDEQRTIPAYAENGVQIPVEADSIYAVEIDIHADWSDPPETVNLNIHDAQIKDVSTDWTYMPDAAFLECVVKLDGPDSDRYRVYFTADNVPYYLRADNKDMTFLDNMDELKYTLYRITDVLDDDGQNNYDDFNFYVPPAWSTACYESCLRPTSLFSVQTLDFGSIGSVPFPVTSAGDWIDYSVCTGVKFVTWCPHHTEYLMSIPDQFAEYEPFGTIVEVEDAMLAVRTQVDGMTSIGGEEAETFTPRSIIWNQGGGEGNSSGFTGFVPSGSGSVFSDGFTWDPSQTVDTSVAQGGETEASSYVEYCLPVFTPLFGASTTNVFCRMVNVLRGGVFMNMVWIPLQFIVDLYALLQLFAYIKRAWIDTGASS